MEIQIKCLYDKLASVKSLKPHPKNRNTHPKDQIERLAKLIQYQGLRAPIVVSNLSKNIVKGHGTLEACKLNKMKEVPVVYQDFENEEQEYAFLQSDNAIANWAVLDFSGLNDDLQHLGPDFDIEMLGLKDFELEPWDTDIEPYSKKEAELPDIKILINCDKKKKEMLLEELASYLNKQEVNFKIVT